MLSKLVDTDVMSILSKSCLSNLMSNVNGSPPNSTNSLPINLLDVSTIASMSVVIC